MSCCTESGISTCDQRLLLIKCQFSTGSGMYTPLPGSPDEEILLDRARQLQSLPGLEKLLLAECKVIASKSHPCAKRAMELGLSEILLLHMSSREQCTGRHAICDVSS